jgi:hypothetical protein
LSSSFSQGPTSAVSSRSFPRPHCRSALDIILPVTQHSADSIFTLCMPSALVFQVERKILHYLP